MNRDPSALMPNGLASLWVVWIFMFHSGAISVIKFKGILKILPMRLLLDSIYF